jgi:hypothetical protein
MSRRTGKAATRRARQQRRARQGPTTYPSAVEPVVPEESVESPPAVEAEAPTTRRTPGMPSWRSSGSSSSRLAESARVEYHYVGRDLRNTAILTLIMAGLLAVAVILVNASGIIPS